MARMAVMKKARGSPLLGRVTNSAATTAEGTAVLPERLEDRSGLGGRDRDWHFVHHEIINTEVKHDSIRSCKTTQGTILGSAAENPGYAGLLPSATITQAMTDLSSEATPSYPGFSRLGLKTDLHRFDQFTPR